MPTVKIECTSCRGTGLYQGFAEAKDTAVVCLGCNGTGAEDFAYAPFTGRKRAKGPAIKYVRRSRGSFIGTGVGPAGGKITVAEFYAGKMP